MRGRGLAVLALVVLLCGPAAETASAHAGLTLSDPPAGSALGAAPTAIRLTFTEDAQASLSSIRVLDADGVARQTGRVEAVPGDPRSVAARVGRLGRGVYTVSWRVVSADDGHATTGAYAFGVGVAPTAAAAAATYTTSPVASRLEVVSRWLLLVGLVALLGAGVAGAARFAGPAGADVRLGAGGWVVAAAGLVLLADAQRRIAGASVGALLDTPVGDALVRRGVAIGAAGALLLVAWRTSGQRHRVAMAGVALASLGAVVAHVAAGHAASGGWPHRLSVALQSTHFAAVAIWIGGLAALLLGLRDTSSPARRTEAVGRFRIAAAAGLVLVAATGVVRAVDELTSWHDLVSTGYGRAVVAKVALLVTIAAIAVGNRQRSMRAGGSAGPSGRLSAAELVLAACALAAAALLGTLAPPAAGRLVAPLGITVTGSDPRSTIEVRLEAASRQPGPNRFVVNVVDFRSHEPIRTNGVTLRFTPLDDPGVAPTSLALAHASDLSYAGTGANIIFDGRWGVTALVQRPGDLVQVPLELDAPTPPQFVSVEAFPGRPTKYTVDVASSASVRISPHPERAGPSRLYVNMYDAFGNVVRAKRLVVTTAAGDGPPRKWPARPAGNRWVADVELGAGGNTIAVVAKTTLGARLRAVLQLDVAEG
jgi:copper transport protein